MRVPYPSVCTAVPDPAELLRGAGLRYPRSATLCGTRVRCVSRPHRPTTSERNPARCEWLLAENPEVLAQTVARARHDILRRLDARQSLVANRFGPPPANGRRGRQTP